MASVENSKLKTSKPEGHTGDSALQTRDLTLGYPSKNDGGILFEKLNLSLFPGQLVCFMGPNGIGKSTLIRTLAGLQKPLSGGITMKSLKDGADDREGKISVVLTDKITSTNMTVRELVTFGRYPFLHWNIHLSKADHEVIDQSLDQVHISHLAHKKLFELSDGQMQMTMIALALAQDTGVLLLDEPTAHLDMNNRLEVMNLLRSICRSTGKAILMATHELDLALQRADVIWLATLNKTIRSAIPEDLVLDGSFDEVFQFKGFNLRTGKVDQEQYQQVTVRLAGEGHQYLWTKNALERNGFAVLPDGKLEIVVHPGPPLCWTLSGERKFHTLSDLLDELIKT